MSDDAAEPMVAFKELKMWNCKQKTGEKRKVGDVRGDGTIPVGFVDCFF